MDIIPIQLRSIKKLVTVMIILDIIKPFLRIKVINGSPEVLNVFEATTMSQSKIST